MYPIALEEHFVTQDFLRAVGGMPPQMARAQEALLDLGEGRLASMDAAGIGHQVLSLAANGLDHLDAHTGTPLVRDINDELATAVKAHPSRFSGFATLCLKDPEAAARELERCVRELGFVGAMLDGMCDGKFTDQPEFFPIFETAVRLNVPIYLHPAAPPKEVADVYFSGLPGHTGMLLSIAGWGWHAETGLHMLRLIVSGLFDRLPNLQLIIGHMGEGVPYSLARSSKVLTAGATHLQKSVQETFLENVYVTTSGYFTTPPLKCALEVLGTDRLMFSIDYPFSSNQQGRDYLEEVERSVGLAADDFEAFASGNARRVIGLP